ncbi:hypothetical protein C8T65DRAFT_699451 [Cerioporus squamosus]|nr:hypothetical protein C8T65DRAFT_699451 [Cerioporus squamosus]
MDGIRNLEQYGRRSILEQDYLYVVIPLPSPLGILQSPEDVRSRDAMKAEGVRLLYRSWMGHSQGGAAPRSKAKLIEGLIKDEVSIDWGRVNDWSPDIVSDHELHSTVESHLASEDIAEMVLGAGLTDTLEWDDEPARAETALGTVSEGTSTTLCDIPLSESEDTLGSGISELEVIELRWNGDVIYGGVVYADDEDSVADNLSDLVFATNAIEPTVAGPRYDVNGYLIEDEEDMIIGSLLDD